MARRWAGLAAGGAAAGLAAAALSVAAPGCASARPPPQGSAPAARGAASNPGATGAAAAAVLPSSPTSEERWQADGGAAPAPAPAAWEQDGGAAPAPAAWEQREDPAALEALVRQAEEEAARSETPAAALLRAARGRRFRAEALAARAAAAEASAGPGAGASELMLEQANDAQACASDAHRSWASLSPAAAAAAQQGLSPAEVARLVPAAAAEALYLDAVCSAAWARAQGFTPLVERRAELQAALERAAELAPDLDDAGPDRELGKLLAALPAYAGGNLREARARFDSAVARAPTSIANHLLYARTVAIKLQDRPLFELQLRAALEQAPHSPEERASLAEAKELLSRADDLFGSSAQ